MSVGFQLQVTIDDEVDEDGVYQVRVEPLGIATFGHSVEHAKAQAEDAVMSYVAALLERNALLDEFTRLGVEFTETRVVSRERQTYLETPIGPTNAPVTGRTLIPV